MLDIYVKEGHLKSFNCKLMDLKNKLIMFLSLVLIQDKDSLPEPFFREVPTK